MTCTRTLASTLLTTVLLLACDSPEDPSPEDLAGETEGSDPEPEPGLPTELAPDLDPQTTSRSRGRLGARGTMLRNDVDGSTLTNLALVQWDTYATNWMNVELVLDYMAGRTGIYAYTSVPVYFDQFRIDR